MSVILYDTYTDTEGVDLANHKSNSGATYTKHASFTESLLIQSNRVGKDANTLTTAYYASVIPTCVEYEAECVIVDVGDVARACGMGLWIDTAADNMIIARRQNQTNWQFGKILAGVLTSLETIATSFSAGAETALKVWRRDDKFYFSVGGTLSPLSPHTITDAIFQTPGRVGIRASNNHSGTGFHLDNFLVNTRYGARVGMGLRPRIFAPGIAR